MVWEIDSIKRDRQYYLILFILLVFNNVARVVFQSMENTLAAGISLLVHLLLVILFLFIFMRVAVNLLNLKTTEIIIYSILFFIPFLGIILIAYFDNKIFHRIKEEEAELGNEVKVFCGLTIWSIVFCWFPLLGLPLAINALVKIRKSEGRLTGLYVAWFAIAANSFFLVTYLWIIYQVRS